jgi:hypothetical protein
MRKMIPAIRQAATLIAIMAFAWSTAHAANIQYTNANVCAFRLEGRVVDGDFQRLRQLVIRRLPFDRLDERAASLCLKSEGGLYDEALKIAELIYDQSMSTVVEYGSECFSACAIIFMAGVMPNHTGPYRKLSVGGILGFHAPYLDVPDKRYSKQDIESVALGMTKAILALVQLSSKEMKMGGEALKKSLVQRILENEKNQVFLIKTVFDAARWNIDLYDADDYFKTELATVRGAINMCNNFHFSNLDKDVQAEDLSVQIEEYSSKFYPKDFRVLVRNSRTKDVVCELYPKEDKQKRIMVTACSYDYWSSRSFGDCREYKTRPTILIGKHVPSFFALDPGAVLKSFQR